MVISTRSNNCGPFQFTEKLIPVVIQKARDGQAIPVYGKGENVRDWPHVDDHASALIAMAQRGAPGRPYLVGGRSERANLAIVVAVCDRRGQLRPAGQPRRELIRFVAVRPGLDFRYAVGRSKCERELGWRARRRLDDGLGETVDWRLANQAWRRPLRDKVYAAARRGTG